MKRTGKLFALLAAIVMALVLVPRLAWGDETVNGNTSGNTQGVLGTDSAEIKISNPKNGETYTVYRLFELASFADESPQAANHGTNDGDEAYSYVIDETSGWYYFLTNYGPTGKTGTHYATLTQSNETSAGQDHIYDDTEAANAGFYFLIESNKVSINGNTNYHVIKATNKFSNVWDDQSDATVRNANGEAASTNAVGVDYVGTKNQKTVQDFAQEALKYAKNPEDGHAVSAVSTVTASSNNETVLLSSSVITSGQNAYLGYYLVGTTMGTLTSLDTTNATVTIKEKNDEPALEKKVLKKGGSIPANASSYNDSFLIGDNSNTWVNNTDADVGDYVMYRTVMTVQQGMYNYILHDVMENGLTFVNETKSGAVETDRYTGKTDNDYQLKVYIVRTAGSPAQTTCYTVAPSATFESTTGTNYELKAVTESETTNKPTDDCDFEIAFKDFDGSQAGNDKVTLAVVKVGNSNTELLDIKDGDKIVVTYWAQVNEKAIIFNNTESQNGDTDTQKEGQKGHTAPTLTTSDGLGNITVPEDVKKDNNSDERNTNYTVLTFGEKSYTSFEKATVTTYQFDIVKTNASTGGTSSLLTGAEFELYKAAVVEGGQDFTLGENKYKKEGNSPLYFVHIANEAGAYLFKSDVSTGGNTILTTTNTEELHLEGLEAGTYLLIETKAPTGYNKLANPIVITINGGADAGSTASPSTNEGTITSVFYPSSGAGATSSTNGAWDAKVTNAASGENAAQYTSTSNGGIQIVNQAGQELPSTGGLGTKAFYAIGGSLFAASVIFLLTKKRLMQAA